MNTSQFEARVLMGPCSDGGDMDPLRTRLRQPTKDYVLDKLLGQFQSDGVA